jgi:hypothetical protein
VHPPPISPENLIATLDQAWTRPLEVRLTLEEKGVIGCGFGIERISEWNKSVKSVTQSPERTRDSIPRALLITRTVHIVTEISPRNLSGNSFGGTTLPRLR